MLRKIFGPVRDEVAGKWRRLHNEELYALYSTSNITGVIKSRITNKPGHVVRMRDGRVASLVLFLILEEKK